jgi:hypothetical protein
MASERSRYGLVLSACGTILLAVSVFLPWYGVHFTASGVALLQQSADQLADQFGNATLQGYVASQHASIAGLAGHELAAVSAHQALKNLNIVLLVLAGLALLDALIALAASSDSAPGGGAAVLLLGGIASVCVVYRMLHPPELDAGLVSLSLREGAWLALLGSLTIVAGGLWPRPAREGHRADGGSEDPWAVLSGWTPQS